MHHHSSNLILLPHQAAEAPAHMLIVTTKPVIQAYHVNATVQRQVSLHKHLEQLWPNELLPMPLKLIDPSELTVNI